MKQRTITAILALIVFIPFIIIGGFAFELFVYLLATIALFELVRMRKIGGYMVPPILAVLLLWILLLRDSLFLLTDFSKFEWVTIIILLLLAYTVLVKNKFTFDHAGFILLATFYVGIGFYYLIETRDGSGIVGLKNIFYAFLIVWSTDTGAYLFGRAFGKRKLWPTISPNKTIEGALGGIVLAIVISVIFHLITPFPHSLLAVILVTIIASIFGQIGDLVESALKRIYGVKDSGKILPGHGGILDRFDSLLFVIPLLHIIQFF
ncbi:MULTISPECIES: phosphatidate cytidylyltransferase [Bacillaceae]|uniref:Phosphatidate cytidylyltransferase n=1 Tax=Oceanobacillus caeni TaxID=405946 RepID=A0ABR5MLG9_9BACI|nr:MULTISPECIES: phosphatidate cytidylyltransferase [Bacillaceae]KPH76988.1 phosphatidate cytidylyltransferase [Oceanobacillus caeni]MED4474627.1 phosphatidate cytidylyltransferase [Oceanobacillus caeni]